MMSGQKELEESARRIAERAHRAQAEAEMRARKRRRVVEYVLDKWLDFAAIVIALVALIRTF